MMKLERPPEPEFLQEHSTQWGAEFAEKRAENSSARFQWRKYNGQSTRKLIVAALEPMCDGHCSYCDGYPLGPQSQVTIDHFRPKSKPEFFHLVYSWPNLFIACNTCQRQKREQFSDDLLKPDEPSYLFEHYFMLDYKTGDIQVNRFAPDEQQRRAEATIKILGLNDGRRPQDRLLEYRKYKALPSDEWDINDFSYRFFIQD